MTPFRPLGSLSRDSALAQAASLTRGGGWGPGTLGSSGASLFNVISWVMLPPRACVLNKIYRKVELFLLSSQSSGVSIIRHALLFFIHYILLLPF